jgi:hypothetical protein
MGRGLPLPPYPSDLKGWGWVIEPDCDFLWKCNADLTSLSIKEFHIIEGLYRVSHDFMLVLQSVISKVMSCLILNSYRAVGVCNWIMLSYQLLSSTVQIAADQNTRYSG